MLGLTALGCAPEPVTSESESGGEGGAEEIEIYGYFLAAEQSYCGWAARCGGVPDEETCREVLHFDELFRTGLLASGEFVGYGAGASVKYLLESFEAGQIEFDAEAATACLTWVEARGCGRPGTFVPDAEALAGQAACAGALRGTMVNYGPCVLSIECAREEDEVAVCGFDPNCTDMCCVGSCRVTRPQAVPLGASCAGGIPCAEGSYCAFDPMTGTPTVCTAQVGAGAPCSFGNECGGGTWCDYNNGAPVCTPPLKVGADCSSGGICSAGSFCAYDGNILRCTPYGGPGALCQGLATCAQLDNYCNVDGRCASRLPVGANCFYDDAACAFGSYCEYGTERCETAGGEGEACGSGMTGGYYVSRPCVGDLVCDGGELATSRCGVPAVTSVCPVPELLPLPGADG